MKIIFKKKTHFPLSKPLPPPKKKKKKTSQPSTGPPVRSLSPAMRAPRSASASRSGEGAPKGGYPRDIFWFWFSVFVSFVFLLVCWCFLSWHFCASFGWFLGLLFVYQKKKMFLCLLDLLVVCVVVGVVVGLLARWCGGWCVACWLVCRSCSFFLEVLWVSSSRLTWSHLLLVCARLLSCGFCFLCLLFGVAVFHCGFFMPGFVVIFTH